MKPLEQLGREVADELDRAPEPIDERARARAGFLAATGTPKAAPRWRGRMTIVAGAVAAAAAGAFWFREAPRARITTFDVGASTVQAGVVGRWMEASDAELPLRFSDGSTVLLTQGARGRVDGTTENGATLSLDRGRAVVSVRHQPATKWSVVAGPFQIAVTGTRFNVEWDPRVEMFTLVMEDGSVMVSGPPPYEAVPLVAGQTFRASLAKPSASPPASDSATAPPPPQPPEIGGRATSDAPATSARPSAEEPGWRELAQRGEYARAIQAVERDGTPAVLASASASDLLLLGDAARFVGKTTLAREAYAIVRSRFPGSAAAAQAAFMLGRLGGDLVWYQRYLAEAPDGPLAREALGRMLELQQTTAPSDALRTAKRYLSSFPSGPHAALAKSIVAREQGESAPPPSSSKQ